MQTTAEAKQTDVVIIGAVFGRLAGSEAGAYAVRRGTA